MFSTDIRAEIGIDAPPEAVWDVLADVEGWRRWSSLLLGLRLDGPLQVGTKGRVPIKLGRIVVPPRIELVVVDRPRELTWVGGVRGLFLGRHGFRLSADGPGTRVVHREVFSGALTLGLKLVRAQMVARYRAFNEELRRRCETGR